MSVPRPLSLPEEFVLFSHRNRGKIDDLRRTAAGSAAAELGELALRRKLLVHSRKSTIGGFEVFHGAGEIRLLDTSRTGLAWADELLGELERRGAPKEGLVSLHKWLGERRRAAFSQHRAALAERGLLRRKSGPVLFGERHFPDRVARDELIARIRATSSGQLQLDEHLLVLCDLAEHAGPRDLKTRVILRQRLNRARGVGAVASLPVDLRDTSAVLSGAMVMWSSR